MKQRGFTLLEVLVSIGIIASIGILITQVFVSTSRSNNKSEAIRSIKQNGDFALQSMERLIYNADRVSCETVGAPVKSISLENFDGNTVSLGCIYSDTVTRIASSSSLGTTDFLTSNNMTMSGADCANSTLTFTCQNVAGVPSQVTINFVLFSRSEVSDLSNQAYVVFQGTASPRNY